MITIHGYFYDGKTSAQTAAVCRVYDNGAVRITADAGERPLLTIGSLQSVDISSRLADTPRYLYFAGGEKFETGDNDAVDRLVSRFRKGHRLGRIIYQLEHRKRFVLAALAVMIGVVWFTVSYGVPTAARWIAFSLPESVAQIAARQTLEALDHSVFQPSELDAAVRERVVTAFAPVVAAHAPVVVAVRFRKGGRVGPNAFALPDGTVIFTDEMIQAAETDDELVAVLSHEIGHVVHRHGLRRVVQDSLLGFAMLAITGDAAGTSELFYAMPVMLTELAYSREFEREADRYALEYLRAHHVDPAHFAHLMRRIDRRQKESHDAANGGSWTTYLSTHPHIEERLEAFE